MSTNQIKGDICIKLYQCLIHKFSSTSSQLTIFQNLFLQLQTQENGCVKFLEAHVNCFCIFLLLKMVKKKTLENHVNVIKLKKQYDGRFSSEATSPRPFRKVWGHIARSRCALENPALQMKGRWESNINVWFPFMYSQKWNCSFQNRIVMFCLPLPTLIYLWEIYIFPGSVCLFCCREICGLILGI